MSSHWSSWVDQHHFLQGLPFVLRSPIIATTLSTPDAAQRNKKSSRGGRGGGRQHSSSQQPMVTLFYDSVKKLTVAVLAPRADPTLRQYLDCRVHAGTAYQVSPLYVELEGYIRENHHHIQQQLQKSEQQYSEHENMDATNERVSIAIGSLEESDDAQRHELQSEQSACHNERVDDATLERVLEIARLHRLEEDLDVPSIFWMRQTCKSFAKVAFRIAHSRLVSTQLVVTPFVDGVSLSGYSKVVRRDGSIPLESMSLVRQTESGRQIEYEQGRDIRLVAAATNTSSIHVNASPQRDVVCFQPVPESIADVSWRCEEMTLAILHRWWGDITLPDYVGQKLVLSWIIGKGSVDDLEHLHDSPKVVLATLKLPVEVHLSRGVRDWSLPLRASVRLCVHESMRTHMDDVSMSYEGRMELVSVNLDFLSLVRASARAMVPILRETYRRMEDTRPLLVHEVQHMKQMETLARLAT